MLSCTWHVDCTEDVANKGDDELDDTRISFNVVTRGNDTTACRFEDFVEGGRTTLTLGLACLAKRYIVSKFDF